MPKDYTFHRLRHRYTSILLKEGVRDRVTLEKRRDAHHSTTASIYQYVSSDDQPAAAQIAQDWLDRALRARLIRARLIWSYFHFQLCEWLV